jgi:hypothetical protein
VEQTTCTASGSLALEGLAFENVTAHSLMKSEAAGSRIRMAELGETDAPKQLVPGNAANITPRLKPCAPGPTTTLKPGPAPTVPAEDAEGGARERRK